MEMECYVESGKNNSGVKSTWTKTNYIKYTLFLNEVLIIIKEVKYNKSKVKY